MDGSRIAPVGLSQAACSRRRLLQGSAALGAAAVLGAPHIARAQPKSPLAGKSIHMSILGIAGWAPSRMGVDMSPDFAKYAKEHYGYDVTFSFAEAPFSQLFQKAATSLATRSQEYNIIISDSQWLGALATPKWILPLNDIIAKDPELNVKWYVDSVRLSYQVFPDGSDRLWGFPEEGDVLGLYIRKDILEGPGEAEAFQARYGRKLPTTWDDFEAQTYEEFLQLAEFFTRPDKGYYGTGTQYSREYDFIADTAMSYMRSMGGDIWDAKTGQVEGILDTPGNARALQMYKDLLKFQPPGAVNFGISELIDAFTQGKCFSAWHWCAVGPAMITPELKGKVEVMPLPTFKDQVGKPNRNYIIGGQPWVLNAFNDSEHQRVALDFMKWWFLPETMLAAAHRGLNPCDKATLTRPDFDSIQPWFRAYKFMLQYNSDFWHDPAYAAMLAVMQEGFTSFASGQVSDPLHALKYVACKQQQILFDEGTAKTAPTGACSGIQLL